MYILLWILVTDSTSFTYGWVRNGYFFGHNSVIFWPFSTYIAIIISWCPKIGIGFCTAGVTALPSTLGTKNCRGQLL